jgi:hypothetical protein
MKSTAVKIVAVSMAVIVPLFFYCSENPSDPIEQQPPIVPPKSTMAMDFSQFSQSALAKADSKSNWLRAAGNVAVWNTVLTVTLAIPVAAFAESFNHPPVLQPDGRWLWSYNYNLGTVQYTARLYGKVSLEGLQWDMYITQHGLFADFHWFTGRSDLLATVGYWKMNLKPLDPIPFLQIDWHRDEDNQAIDVKYTNIVPDGAENGSYIYQAFNQEPPFTGMYDIFSVGAANLIEIKWNRETTAGRIKDPKHYNDEEWHCWDSSRNDAACD